MADLAFSIVGCDFEARGLPDPIAAFLRAMWAFEPRGAPPRDFSIRIAWEEPPTPEALIWHEARLFERTVRVAETRDGYLGPGALFRFSERTLDVKLWKDDEDAVAALHLAVAEGVRASGLLPLHSSVAARGGRAVALLGASGAGKSTTVMRLARAGWRPIAEDLAWLDPATLRIDGFDRGLRVLPGTLERFAPELAPSVRQRDETGKEVLSYDLFSAHGERAAFLDTLAELARAERTSTSPLAPRDLALALWNASGAPVAREARTATAAGVNAVVAAVRAGSVSAERWHLDAQRLPSGVQAPA